MDLMEASYPLSRHRPEQREAKTSTNRGRPRRAQQLEPASINLENVKKINPKPRKIAYDRYFLLQQRFSPASLVKPNVLLPELILNKSKTFGSKRRRLKQKLLKPKMQEIYANACLKGTRNVYQSRVMLIGYFGAGKTSVKRRLLNELFVEAHLSTDGVTMATEGEQCTVDVDTVDITNWQKEPLNLKREWKEEVAKTLLRKSDNAASAGTELIPRPTEELFEEIRPSSLNTPSSTRGTVATDIFNIKSGKKTSRQVKVTQTLLDRLEEPSAFVGPDAEDLEELLKSMHADVIETSLRLPQCKSKKAVFTIWDFGGQQIYYTSHQTFLSRRAIYLLVMDISRQLDEEVERGPEHRMWKDSGSPRTVGDFLDFWLKSIHTLAAPSETDGETLQPPVIIVCTKKDLLSQNKEVRAAEIEAFIRSIHEHLEGKPYYEHVRDIIAISNCDLNDDGVDRLREGIVEVATRQPFWGEERPNRWLLLADELSQRRLDNKEEPVLPLKEVIQMAKKVGVAKDEVPAFLEFHHNLGDVIHFDQEGVADSVVLCPQWLANMFSKVITQHYLTKQSHLPSDQQQMLKYGIFSEQAATSLSGVSDPAILLRIMELFDMLIPCQIINTEQKKQVYFVPCLMPKASEDQVEEVNPSVPSLHFKCVSPTDVKPQDFKKQDFLPPGLFHRLVSACCRVRRWRHYENLIFSDYAVFDVGHFCFALRMIHNGITLSASRLQGDPLKHSAALNNLREEVLSLIQEITSSTFPGLTTDTFLVCVCSRSAATSGRKTFQARMAMQSPGLIPLAEIGGEFTGRTSCDRHRMLVELSPWKVWFGAELEVIDTGLLHPEGQELYKDLQPHMRILLQAMPHKVQNCLVETKLLLVEDLKAIEAKNTTFEQNVELYQLVLSRTKQVKDKEEVKKAVCKGLCTSAQYCPFQNQHQPASASQNEALHKLRSRLTEDMEVFPVLHWLYQEGLVDDHIKECISSFKTRRDRVHRLLDIVHRMHMQAQDTFMDILQKTNTWIFE